MTTDTPETFAEALSQVQSYTEAHSAEAEAAVKVALTLAEGNTQKAQVHQALGVIHRNKNRLVEAKAALEAARALLPAHDRLLAGVLRDLGNIARDQSEELYALRQYPQANLEAIAARKLYASSCKYAEKSEQFDELFATRSALGLLNVQYGRRTGDVHCEKNGLIQLQHAAGFLIAINNRVYAKNALITLMRVSWRDRWKPQNIVRAFRLAQTSADVLRVLASLLGNTIYTMTRKIWR